MNSSGQDNRNGRPAVLVVGPFSTVGGIGTVCRNMRVGELARDWRVLPLDNTKITPADRSVLTAVGVHAVLLLRLVGAIVRHRPALVHIHTCSYQTFFRSMADILLARLLLRPVVLHIHGGYFHEFLSGLGRVRRRLVLAHLRMARRVVVLGEVWKQCLESALPRGRVGVVANGVPIPRAARTTRRRKPLQIVCVGDLSPGKGLEDLIEAVVRLAPALRRRLRVELIGGGTTERRALLERLIINRGLGRQIRLLGQQTAPRTQARLRHADVFVLPSRGEGLPVALLEAMAWGIPSVVTRVGAIPQTVTDEVEGCVIDPGDVSALTDRLTRLLSHVRLRVSMGRRARERAVAEFALDRFHAGLDRVWTEALGAHATLAVPTAPAG